MPLTAFQKEVAKLLACNRTGGSHLAGGAVINRHDDAPRFSADLDIFHDNADDVAASADRDAGLLRGAGCVVEWVTEKRGFRQGTVSRAGQRTRLDWTIDSPFRFFPVQPDEEFGSCLHPADLATNKLLALAGRIEIRDYLDVLHLDGTYLSLGAMAWAACGKDTGFTPALLLDFGNRHARFTEEDLRGVFLARPVDLKALKLHWLAAKDKAERLFSRLPRAELGCLYLDEMNRPVTPDPDSPAFVSLKRHRGRIEGSWPATP